VKFVPQVANVNNSTTALLSVMEVKVAEMRSLVSAPARTLSALTRPVTRTAVRVLQLLDSLAVPPPS
jgi:hypothetical protein